MRPRSLWPRQSHLVCSLLNKHIQPLPKYKGGGFPVPPMILVVGVGFVLTLVAGILFACKLWQVGLTISALMATASNVVEKLPLSQFRNILKCNRMKKAEEQLSEDIELQPIWRTTMQTLALAPTHTEAPSISNIIWEAFSSERDTRWYAKHLECKEVAEQEVQPSAPKA